MGRSASSRRWLDRQANDHYVKQARKEGYASRASYKLIEAQEKHTLFKPGMRVIDLGAAPGGWSQVCAQWVKPGRVYALDLLPLTVEPAGVHFIQGDFCDEAVLSELTDALDGAKVDVVLSDMAPNLSGHPSVDVPKMMYLLDLAWSLAQDVLVKEGVFLVKAFRGEGVDDFIRMLKKHFSKVKQLKPEASRAKSREFYILAKGFIGYTN